MQVRLHALRSTSPSLKLVRAPGWHATAGKKSIQGYLAHMKTPTPLGPP